MRRAILAMAMGAMGWLALTPGEAAEKGRNDADPQARAVEQAAPERPFAKPGRPRRLLVYGRVPTHPESVKACFQAMEVLGRKSGAFEAVASGDPAMFLPENLKRFDAVLMNNTHESHPLLPDDFKKLPGSEQATAKERETLLKRSFLEFVARGKGLVGIHGATCSVQWPEYLEVLGGRYASHIAGEVWVKAEEPAHPLCAAIGAPSFAVNDEIYLFGPPYARDKLRVLATLDLAKTKDPGKRPDKDYAVSWVRTYGQGRVFYCSLGHNPAVYRNPHVLRHYLAGIQYALGDLPAEAK